MINKYLLNLVRITEQDNPIYKITRSHLDCHEFVASWWIYLSDGFANAIMGREIDTYLTYPYKPCQEDWKVGFYAEVEGFQSILGNEELDIENYNENLSSLGAGCIHLSRYI